MDFRHPPAVLVTRIAVPVLIVLFGVMVFAVLRATAPQVARVDHAAAPPDVLVFEARPLPVRRQWRGYGTAEADVAADVPARLTATVAEVPAGVQEGAAVEAGQVLVRLDPSDFQRRVEQAEQSLAAIGAQLTQLAAEEASLRERLPIEENDIAIAEREVERVREVVERGAGNQQDLDTAERNLLAAQRNRWQVTQAIAQLEARRAGLQAQESAQQSALRAAREDLTRTEIVSPIDGVLQSVDVKVGESVSQGQPVARVSNLGVIEVPVRLAASAREQIDIGDEAMLQAASQPELCWNAKVERLAPEDDTQTRTMTAYLVVDQTHELAAGGRLFHPGRFVEATVTEADPAPRWIVPRRAVRAGRIFVVDERGVAHSMPIDIAFPLQGDFSEATGLVDDQWVVLTEDSAEAAFRRGTRVVVNASASLMDGGRVTPVPAGTTATQAAEDATQAGGVARREAADERGAAP